MISLWFDNNSESNLAINEQSSSEYSLVESSGTGLLQSASQSAGNEDMDGKGWTPETHWSIETQSRTQGVGSLYNRRDRSVWSIPVFRSVTVKNLMVSESLTGKPTQKYWAVPHFDLIRKLRWWRARAIEKNRIVAWGNRTPDLWVRNPTCRHFQSTSYTAVHLYSTLF